MRPIVPPVTWLSSSPLLLYDEKPQLARMISQGSHKTIDKFRINVVDIYFDSNTKKLIQILEILEHSNKIVNKDFDKTANFIKDNLSCYSIAHFKSIISHKKYQYSTVASLARAIKLEKQDDEYCIDIYEEFGLKQ